MSRQDYFEKGLVSARQSRVWITFQYGLERLCVLPLRMIGRERPYTIECKQELDVKRLFSP